MHRFKVDDRVQRDYKKYKAWKDTPEMRPHNHATVIALVDGEDDKGRKMSGYQIRTDADSAILRDPKAEAWDKRYAEKGTFYGDSELMPEGD